MSVEDLIGYRFSVEGGKATVTGAGAAPGYVNVRIDREGAKPIESVRAASHVRQHRLSRPSPFQRPSSE